MTDVGRRKMEKYEQLAVVGEGSYGLVMKCRHRESDQIVAVKKFLETEEDATVRRMALREIRMLKKLRHENLVTMIEVFRYRKRFYLVFEYLEGTVLDELEKMPGGLGDERSRERIYQVTRAINFCHSNHIIHRDVKPENVLVSSMGVVKLCDFGFARLVSVNGEPCTEYVATRWYRAPELLVGEQQYGPSVDIWAVGCLFAEMMTGDPLFPGDSDIDQLYLIVRMIGKPCTRHQQIIAKTNHLKGIIKSAAAESNGLYKTFSNWSLLSLDFLISCMKMDPFNRPTADELLRHNYFTHDRFPQKFLPALREKVLIEFNANPLLRKYKADILMSTDRKDEIRQRRSLQVDPPKWKISLTEGSIKRKFSCDTVSSSSGCDLTFGGDRSPMNATTKVSGNGAHRLINVGQKSGTSSFFIKPPHHHHSSYKSLSKQSTPKISGGQLSGRETELHKLEKSLENLAKLANQKSDSLRPVSAQKDNKKMGSPIVSGSPPPPFQSLQANIPDYSKSPGITQQQQQQQVLHPTINNISFTKAVGVDTSKKSPNLLQNIHSTCIKNTFNQVPLVNPPRGHYLKKLDRNLVLDSMFMNVEPVVVNQQNQLLMAPSWLNGNNNNMAGGSSHHHYLPKRKESKPKADEFTLPNLPGATASPNKTKKKTHPSPEHHQKAIVTPRIVQSSASQKSSASKFIITTSSHSSSFPFM